LDLGAISHTFNRVVLATKVFSNVYFQVELVEGMFTPVLGNGEVGKLQEVSLLP